MTLVPARPGPPTLGLPPSQAYDGAMSAISVPAAVDHEPEGFGRALGITTAVLCPLVAVGSLVLSLVVGFDLAGSLGFALFTTVTAGFGFALIIAGAVWGSSVTEDH